jgi:hypothetical protein
MRGRAGGKTSEILVFYAAVCSLHGYELTVGFLVGNITYFLGLVRMRGVELHSHVLDERCSKCFLERNRPGDIPDVPLQLKQLFYRSQQSRVPAWPHDLPYLSQLCPNSHMSDLKRGE